MRNKNRLRPGGLSFVFVALFCVAALVASSAKAADTDNDDSGKDSPNKVVATVGSHKITEKQLDEKLKPQIAMMRAELEKRVDQIIADKTFDMRRKTAETMANQYLVEHAAKKAGMSVAEFEKTAAAGKDGVSDEDAKKYYDENKRPGAPPFDSVKPQLLEMMNRQALIKRLRAESPVHVLIEPARVKVASAGHYSKGPADAPVTIVEFSDFQCPFCRAAEPTLKEVIKKYGDKVRLVYMDYPLPFHAHSADAAKAARCAGDQGKFWEFHDALFANQSKLDPKDLQASAEKLGLDMSKFDACVASSKFADAVKKDSEQGSEVGVNGTPAFFINGREISGAQQAPAFEEIIDDELSNAAGGQKQASAN